MKKNSIILLFLVAFAGISYSQDKDTTWQSLTKRVEALKPGKSKTLLRGYAHSGLEYKEDELTFVGGSFNPILMYRQSEKLFFEGELEFEFEENEFEVGLEYANISYFLTPNLTIRVGMFLVPFGIFNERLHPAWINKFPTAPLGIGHDGIMPESELGGEIRGSTKIIPLKLNYSVYIVNGPQLMVDEKPGRLEYGFITDNNFNKAAGARLGILPIPGSIFEVGFSGQVARVGQRDTPFENVSARLYATDLSLTRKLNFLKSIIDIKGQAAMVKVDDFAYGPLNGNGPITPVFKNQSFTWFGQVAIQPSFLNVKFINNLEAVARYSFIRTPEGALWELAEEQFAFGLNYWLDWRTVFKLTYQLNNTIEGEHHEEESGRNEILFHWAIGF